MRARLEDVCERGSSNLRQADVTGRSGDYPIYGASGYIGNVDFYHQELPYVAIVKDGAGIGRTVLLPAKSSVIGTMQYLLPKKNVLPEYLCYVVRYMHLEKYFSGATIPHIYFRDYKSEEFNLVPVDYQEEIVATLGKIEAIVAARQRQLQKLDELVKARFIELFGDPVYNSKRLPIQRLCKLGSLDRGRSQHRPRNDPKLLNGPYPLIQTGEVASAGLYITKYKNTYSELELRQSKMWSAGTLCITIAANIAQTAILTFDACFPDSVVGFLPNDSINAIYMHYWFGFFQKILEKQAPQVAQKNINLKILSELNVIVPTQEKQEQFAAFVEQTDKSKVAIQKALDEAQLLFDSLMQKYFG